VLEANSLTLSIDWPVLPRETAMDLSAIENILDVLDRHEYDASRTVSMVPSENCMSALAKLPLLMDVYHRYFFNTTESEDEWNFRGAQDVAWLETQFALPLLREFTGAKYVNLRPLSGLSGMAMVLSALGGGRGAKVMTVSPEQGGHYATAKLGERLGIETCYITGPDPHTIDYDQVAATVLREAPELIYVDQSNCLFPLDVHQLVSVVREVAPGTLVHVDCSHWMGLVLGGQIPNPLTAGADSFGGSTHKTFPGPHKAIVATNREDLSQKLAKAQFEMISSHHFAAAISLGIALLEFKLCGGRRYAATLMENTKELAVQLQARGIHVVAADRGFSGGHQLWVRTLPSGIDAYRASDLLYSAGIRVNALPELPGIRERVIRLGVNEATYHGFCPADMQELAAVFAWAVFKEQSSAKLSQHVAALRARYSNAYRFPSDDSRLFSRIMRMVTRVMGPAYLNEISVFVAELALDSTVS
jgi:glycine hydroxymethyltransferase